MDNKSTNNKSIFRGTRMPHDLDRFIKVCQEAIGTTSYGKTMILLLRELMYLITTTNPEILNKLKKENNHD